MKVQNKFSSTTFGGFNKEEVLQYIDALMSKSDEEIKTLKSTVDKTNAQITEFKTIVEEQYTRIVGLTETNTAITDENKIATQKIAELEAELAPFAQAKAQADEVLTSAKVEAEALSDNMKRDIALAAEQTKLIFSQASEKEREIINEAKEKAETIIAIAKEKEAKMLCDAQKQIEETLALSDENQSRSKRLIDGAQREADQIIKKAKLDAESEKCNYYKILRELELQKSKLLLALDEIKAEVRNIQITGLSKSEMETFATMRQNTTNAIKKKFVTLNKEKQCGNPEN